MRIKEDMMQLILLGILGILHSRADITDRKPVQIGGGSLWSVKISLPDGLIARKTQRGGDHGYGVDLKFEPRQQRVKAIGFDDDGNAFFELRARNDAFCKIDVGSNGLDPGLQIMVFAQHGMSCNISGHRGFRTFNVNITAELTSDDSVECRERTEIENPCLPPWKPLATKSPPPSWALWTAIISLPRGSVVKRTHRGQDPGYGVDIAFHGKGTSTPVVEGRVWDDDGSGFFEVFQGNSSCKIDVGSNGLGPKLQVMVFMQNGLDCRIAGDGGPKTFNLALRTALVEDATADCTEKEDTEDPCHPAWTPPVDVEALRKPVLAFSEPPSWAIWMATIQLPAKAVARSTHRGDDPGYGVDILLRGNLVKASVWDDDGDGFFEIVLANGGSCKIDVGSNGLDPELSVAVFEEKGAMCLVHGSGGGPKKFSLSVIAKTQADTECKERAEVETPCHPVWHPHTVALDDVVV
eukprot:TRINITY_DN49286_c0_g1_i1.p1 TRINITY_DN49286_c0_g1~~TRINITY_DN49286_c0_g1_i1.p1  ORF type:complete len:466 (-),score=67.21 TRINITY_DN49286_c0_g1_i1:374-1771(-)